MPEQLGKPHRKLVLWQKAVDFVTLVYGVTGRFPRSEQYGFAGQMRRAAVSVPSKIAEGAVCQSCKEYLHFLHTARGSPSELDTQVEIALRLGYLDEATCAEMQGRFAEISRLLHGVVTYLRKTRAE